MKGGFSVPGVRISTQNGWEGLIFLRNPCTFVLILCTPSPQELYCISDSSATKGCKAGSYSSLFVLHSSLTPYSLSLSSLSQLKNYTEKKGEKGRATEKYQNSGNGQKNSRPTGGYSEYKEVLFEIGCGRGDGSQGKSIR